MLKAEKLAEVIIRHSLKVKKNDKVFITGSNEIMPIVEAMIPLILEEGAFVDVEIKHPVIEEMIMNFGSKEQIGFLPEYVPKRLLEFNKMVSFISDVNLFHKHSSDEKKMTANSYGKKDYIKTYIKLLEEKKLSCAVVLCPTSGYAQYNCMSDVEFIEMYNKYCNLDVDESISEYKKLFERNSKIINVLKNAENIHVKGPGTDIVFSVSGRNWVNCCGELNIPAGEVFSAPVETSVNGHIKITYPAIYNGVEFKDIELEFINGKITSFNSTNNDALKRLLELDEGSALLGEIGFGTNYNIQKFNNNIIFDEKMGGTMHIALGSAYPECGGKNFSMIHLDLLVDTLNGTEVFIDGKLFLSERAFKLEDVNHIE